ncbi:MAG: FAD-dependent oxidoreductase [Deltaproteobacteria bacterium]|nr:FAD-dependent oxidoreductase [Deltaproteobacteria bacterium]
MINNLFGVRFAAIRGMDTTVEKNRQPGNARVLVIGAGLAGLCAALELGRRGIGCVLLEARDRIGGRVWTLDEPALGFPVELGAEFIHGYAPGTLQLLDTFRLASFEVPDRHLLAQKRKITGLPDFWQRIEPALESRPQGNTDVSFHEQLERLPLPPHDKSLARAFVEGFHAADPAELSQRALSLESTAAGRIEGNRAFRLLRGYGALAAELAAALPATLCELVPRAPVESLRWEPGQVEATTTGHLARRFLAEAAIVTVPPGPFQRLTFSPELGEKRKALELLRSGAVLKIVLRFRECFWRRKLAQDVYFIHSSQRHFPTWWSAQPFQWPVLKNTLFFAGEATQAAGLGGTVESAIQSGFRAAAEVAAALSAQAPHARAA